MVLYKKVYEAQFKNTQKTVHHFLETIRFKFNLKTNWFTWILTLLM